MRKGKMSFDHIAKIIELVFTALGLLFVIGGWIIPYKQNQETMKRQRQAEYKSMKRQRRAEYIFRQRQWEKEHIDKQISEFYGPISSLLQEQEIIFNRILYMFGRSCVFSKDQTKLSDLPENEQKIWMHYVDTYKIPLSNRIIDIIQNKKHLIYKSEIPTCFKVYLDYTLGWELLDNQKRNGVPNFYEYFYSYNYPVEFTRYINDTLKLLLKRQAELIGDVNSESTAY